MAHFENTFVMHRPNHMGDIATWVVAIATLSSFVVASMALRSSNAALRSSDAALRASRDTEALNQVIKVALLQFREDLKEGNYFAQQKILDAQMKAMDDKMSQLDHRLTRNSEHTTLMLSVLLKSGIGVDQVARAMDPMHAS